MGWTNNLPIHIIHPKPVNPHNYLSKLWTELSNSELGRGLGDINLQFSGVVGDIMLALLAKLENGGQELTDFYHFVCLDKAEGSNLGFE